MISIVIPTYNEADKIAGLVAFLRKEGKDKIAEIIVADGGSSDRTADLAKTAGALVECCPEPGRALQMNRGAAVATAEVLYFIHADTRPPASFAGDIERSIGEGFGCGRYRTVFDSSKPVLRVNSFFTRFDLFMCYGGDQTFFIRRDLFTRLGGFNNNMRIMEDYEIVQRAKRSSRYKIMQKGVLVSARKYHVNSWITVQKANYTIVRMYRKGASQDAMVNKYRELLNSR